MLAIILSRRDFREYDQIISLYTKEHGKQEALARGVKKITSKNSGSLEPFSVVEVEIIPGKEIDHIGSVQIIELFKNIRGDLIKLFVAQWAVSLTEQLFSIGEPDIASFNLLVSWFQELDHVASVSPIILDALVLRLLARLGFAPGLDRCSVCNRQLGDNQNSIFDVSTGGLICDDCHQKQITSPNLFPLSDVVMRSLRTIMQDDWKIIFSLKLDKKEAVALHKLIYHFAVFHSGKGLKDWQTTGKI